MQETSIDWTNMNCYVNDILCLFSYNTKELSGQSVNHQQSIPPNHPKKTHNAHGQCHPLPSNYRWWQARVFASTLQVFSLHHNSKALVASHFACRGPSIFTQKRWSSVSSPRQVHRLFLNWEKLSQGDCWLWEDRRATWWQPVHSSTLMHPQHWIASTRWSCSPLVRDLNAACCTPSISSHSSCTSVQSILLLSKGTQNQWEMALESCPKAGSFSMFPFIGG